MKKYVWNMGWFDNKKPHLDIMWSIWNGNLKIEKRYEVIVREVKKSEQSKKKGRKNG